MERIDFKNFRAHPHPSGSQLCELVTWYGGRFAPPPKKNRRLDPPVAEKSSKMEIKRQGRVTTQIGHVVFQSTRLNETKKLVGTTYVLINTATTLLS